jgi:hypothetical protein
MKHFAVDLQRDLCIKFVCLFVGMFNSCSLLVLIIERSVRIMINDEAMRNVEENVSGIVPDSLLVLCTP